MSAKKKAAKKAAKKKATKKKAAKKKVAKKKPASSTGPKKFHALSGSRLWFWKVPLKLAQLFFPVNLNRTVVVQFDDQSGGLNHPEAHRLTNDTVWFQNLGSVDRTLTLSHWPFLEQPAAPIFVPAHRTVGPFHLDPADPFTGTIHCHGNPPFPQTGAGPGDPPFDAGD